MCIRDSYQSSLGRYFGYRGFYIEKGSATVVGCRFNCYIYDSDPHAAIERNIAGALTLIGNMTNNFDTGGEGGGVYHACRILGVEAEHSLHGDLEVRGSKWNAAGDTAVVRFGAAGDDNGIAVVYGGPGKMVFCVRKTSGGGTLGGNSLDALTIQEQSGNVGIGITSPAVTLHVKDVLRLEPQSSAPSGSKGDLYAGTDGYLYFHNGTSWKRIRFY